MDEETIFVRCRACRRSFAPPLQVDRGSLEAMVIDAEYVCPWCGATDRFGKEDHWHELVVG